MHHDPLPDDSLLAAMAGDGSIHLGSYNDAVGDPQFLVTGDLDHAAVSTPDGHTLGHLHRVNGRVEFLSEAGNTIAYVDSSGVYDPTGVPRVEASRDGDLTDLNTPGGGIVGHIERTDSGSLIFTPEFRRHDDGPA
jgi:hypothetical protein